MYKCHICRRVSEPRERMRKHVIPRVVPKLGFAGTRIGTREEVAAEIPVCCHCEQRIAEGVRLSVLYREFRRGQVGTPEITREGAAGTNGRKGS